MNDDVLLSAKNLSVRFGGVLAVNDVSFDVKRGEVFTLIGPNGAGKTTVFNLISRIYTPTTGSIAFEGQPLTAQPPHRIASLGKDYLPAAIGQATGLQSVVYGAVLIAFVMLEPMGLYGRWLKVRTYLQLFPFYRQGLFKRQKSFQKSDRLK